MAQRIILASKSPRRSQLLEQAGIKFTIKTRDIEEIYPSTLAAPDVAPYLAELKAEGVKDFLETPDDIILTADSVVILGNTIFGKPKNYEDAVRILRQLSGQKHQVITGVCLLTLQKKKIFSGVSNVYMDALTENEIEYYVKNFQPYDKAGAYAIQEWIGLCKINKIEGTYSNIMGLPVDMVYKALQDL